MTGNFLPRVQIAPKNEQIINMLHTIILHLSNAGWSTATLILIFWAPFVRTWKAFFMTTFVPWAIWGGGRILTIIWFAEDSPPMMGFVAMPFLAFILGIPLRVIVMSVKTMANAFRNKE